MSDPAYIASRRFTNQQIATMSGSTPADVLRWMGAVQGQDFSASTYAVAARSIDLTRADVLDAFANRTIIRTWPFRGTLHVLPSEDAGWIVGLLGHRAIRSAAGRHAQLGLDHHTIDRAMQIFSDAMSDGSCRTRAELYGLLSEADLNPADQRGIHLIGYAAQSGLICGTGFVGKQPAFARMDKWIADPVHRSADEAWTELAWRYIRSHGPVTEADFAWWAGCRLSDAKSAFACNETKLRRLVVDSNAYAEAAIDIDTKASRSEYYFLPAFDEMFIGYADRSALLAKELHGEIVPGKNGIFKPIVVENGRVVATWARGTGGEGEPVVTMLDSSTPDPDRLKSAIGRYRSIVG